MEPKISQLDAATRGDVRSLRDGRVSPLLVIVLTAALVALDLANPLGVATGFAYVVLVLLSLGSSRPRWTTIAMVAAVAFNLVGLAVSWGRVSHTVALADRLASILLILLSGRLVARHKTIVEALGAARGLQATLVESLPQNIVYKDLSGRFTFANQHFCRSLGRDEHEILGKTDHDFYPRALADKYRGDDERVLASGAVWDAIEEHCLPDGATTHVQTVKTPVRDAAGQVVGLLVIFWDVGDRVRAEQERGRLESQVRHAQKLESLGVLAGGIAHDFNNLLMGILGNAGLALMELPEHSPTRETVEQIHRTAERLAELANQMLAYSGKGTLFIEPLDLAKLVREMAPLLASAISKRVKLRAELPRKLPPVAGDATQLRQVVLNLITNASESYADRDGVVIIRAGVVQADRALLADVYLDEFLPEGEYLVLDVIDEGAGMTADVKARIFDPFFTTKFTGRGLGLASVLGIVRGHKGAIKVTSEPGKGSTFRILLPTTDQPAAIEDDETASPKKSKVAPSSTAPVAVAPGRALVLVVDDEETVLDITRRLLERLGFDVLLARDGLEALKLFGEHGERIGVVLLDMTMPRMGGKETYDEIHRRRPELPVVLSSGYPEQDLAGQFAGQAVPPFIQKPYTPATLRETLHAALTRAASLAVAAR